MKYFSALNLFQFRYLESEYENLPFCGFVLVKQWIPVIHYNLCCVLRFYVENSTRTLYIDIYIHETQGGGGWCEVLVLPFYFESSMWLSYLYYHRSTASKIERQSTVKGFHKIECFRT